MKKILICSTLILCLGMFWSCENKDEVPTPSENIAEFSGEIYHLERLTNMVGLPTMFEFTPIVDNVNLIVRTEDNDQVKIKFPSTGYNLAGVQMTIPEFITPNIPVVYDNEGGLRIISHTFDIKGEKRIEGTISAEFSKEGTVYLTTTYKYGNMPFKIKQDFKTVE